MPIKVSDLDDKNTLSGTPDGIEIVEVIGPRPVAGTICKINLRKYEFRIFCFRDIINKSLHPDHGCFTEESVNLGSSVQDFILGRRFECEGLKIYRSWIPLYRDYYRKCLIASNTCQTNFIRSNGFVIENGKIKSKPLYAPGRDDLEYTEKGVAGHYTCLVVKGFNAQVMKLNVIDSEGISTNPPLPDNCFGIASPRLIEDGNFVPLQQHEFPFRDANRRLNGDWVDWDPAKTATSFTAFGVNRSGEVLTIASIFAGEWGIDIDQNSGILVEVMADLLLKHKVYNAILGGGAADTQQYVHWRLPRFRNGPLRIKSFAASRGEVKGIRGLGAIAGILPRN